MGRGNFRIQDIEGVSHPTFYIEYYEHTDEINSDNEPYCNNNPCHCNDPFYDDVTMNIAAMQLLKKADYHINEYRDYHCIGENNVLKLVTADNEWSLAIGCIPVYNENGKYNVGAFKASATKIMKNIAKCYNLRFRSSAWTSGSIENVDKFEFY